MKYLHFHNVFTVLLYCFNFLKSDEENKEDEAVAMSALNEVSNILVRD